MLFRQGALAGLDAHWLWDVRVARCCHLRSPIPSWVSRRTRVIVFSKYTAQRFELPGAGSGMTIRLAVTFSLNAAPKRPVGGRSRVDCLARARLAGNGHKCTEGTFRDGEQQST